MVNNIINEAALVLSGLMNAFPVAILLVLGYNLFSGTNLTIFEALGVWSFIASGYVVFANAVSYWTAQKVKLNFLEGISDFIMANAGKKVE